MNEFEEFQPVGPGFFNQLFNKLRFRLPPSVLAPVVPYWQLAPNPAFQSLQNTEGHRLLALQAHATSQGYKILYYSLYMLLLRQLINPPCTIHSFTRKLIPNLMIFLTTTKARLLGLDNPSTTALLIWSKVSVYQATANEKTCKKS